MLLTLARDFYQREDKSELACIPPSRDFGSGSVRFVYIYVLAGHSRILRGHTCLLCYPRTCQQGLSFDTPAFLRLSSTDSGHVTAVWTPSISNLPISKGYEPSATISDRERLFSLIIQISRIGVKLPSRLHGQSLDRSCMTRRTVINGVYNRHLGRHRHAITLLRERCWYR